MKVREAYIAYKGAGKAVPTRIMDGARAVAQYMAGAFEEHRDQEQFWVILVDTKLQAKARFCTSLGTLDSVAVHPREVFRPAFIGAAHSIILCHNHPSGDPSPSEQDRQVTKLLEEAGAILGIPVIDHVIFAHDDQNPSGFAYYSFNDGKLALSSLQENETVPR